MIGCVCVCVLTATEQFVRFQTEGLKDRYGSEWTNHKSVDT